MKLCVALDLESKKECLELANKLDGLDLWLKVGMRSYYRDGKDFVKELKERGFKVFVDLKLYDIPNTMSDAASELGKLGADMINLHASAGKQALSAVMERLKTELGSSAPLVLAVSALTSFDESGFKEIYKQEISQAVRQMAIISRKAGLNGMVCSAFESALIKSTCGSDFITLCPGIRPILNGEQANKDDQARVADISFAKSVNTDFIVVGRPIYKAKEPKKVVEQILSQF